MHSLVLRPFDLQAYSADPWCSPCAHPVAHSLLDGVSGIAPITRFDASEFPTRFGGQIKDFDAEKWVGSSFPVSSCLLVSSCLPRQWLLVSMKLVKHAHHV